MQVFAFVAATLWVIGFLVLGSWAFYLSIKMETCRIANETGISWRGSKFAFQKKASDYTETGQMYRQSASKIAILANPGNPILPTAEAHADAALMMTIGRVDRFVMGLGEIGHSKTSCAAPSKLPHSHQAGRTQTTTNRGRLRRGTGMPPRA